VENLGGIGIGKTSAGTKKEEFQGTMFDMLPGNSFPRSALFLKAV
jgi:hypothetical protein